MRKGLEKQKSASMLSLPGTSPTVVGCAAYQVLLENLENSLPLEKVRLESLETLENFLLMRRRPWRRVEILQTPQLPQTCLHHSSCLHP